MKEMSSLYFKQVNSLKLKIYKKPLNKNWNFLKTIHYLSSSTLTTISNGSKSQNSNLKRKLKRKMIKTKTKVKGKIKKEITNPKHKILNKLLRKLGKRKRKRRKLLRLQ